MVKEKAKEHTSETARQFIKNVYGNADHVNCLAGIRYYSFRPTTESDVTRKIKDWFVKYIKEIIEQRAREK